MQVIQVDEGWYQLIIDCDRELSLFDPQYKIIQVKEVKFRPGTDEGDYLVGAALTDGKHDVMLFSDGGKAVRFDEDDVRPMGRQARGVRGMALDDGQHVIAMLVAANVYAAQVWMSMDVEMSGAGWLFLILGIVVSIALGGGLMALVFYSSRKNYDR